MFRYTLNALGRPLFFHETDDKGGAGDENKPVPYAEHKKARQALAKAKEEIAALTAKVTEIEKKSPDVAKLAQERDAANARAENAEKDVQLRDLGITDPESRAFLRSRYAQAKQEQGDKAPEFGDWIEGNKEKKWFKAMVEEATPASGEGGEQAPAPKSDYAANKGKPAEGDGKGASGDAKGGAGTGTKQPEKKPAFNPNAGTSGGDGKGGGRPAFTREEIASMSPDEYKANRANIQAARREGRIE